MHKRIVSECLISLNIETQGPLLIKTGIPTLHGPDMSPVMTYRLSDRQEPYIPGSSLKGVLRSHAERIARTLVGASGFGCCNPFLADKNKRHWRETAGACSVKFDHRNELARNDETRRVNSVQAYRDACPICKMFGCTSLQARIAVPDAYLKQGCTYQVEHRDGVGIDRVTGGSADTAKFDLQVITGAIFETTLRLTNFELWQLGLIGLVLHDLDEGLIQIGSGKSRGLGQVFGKVAWIKIQYVSALIPADGDATLLGLRILLPEEADDYGYWTEEENGIAIEGMLGKPDDLGLRTVFFVENVEVMHIWKNLAPIAVQRLRENELAADMQFDDPRMNTGST